MLQELMVIPSGMLKNIKGHDHKALFDMKAPFVSFMQSAPASSSQLQEDFDMGFYAAPAASSPFLQELGTGPVELPSRSYAGMNAYNHFQAEFANCKAKNDCIHGTLTCERMCQAKAKMSPYYQAAVKEAEMMRL